MKYHSPHHVFTSIVLAFGCALVVHADTLTLKEGREVEGKIIKYEAGGVEIEITKGDLKAVSYYSMDEVSKVEYGETPHQVLEKEYQDRLAGTEDTADDWFELGRWCSEQFLAKRADEAYRTALEVDPDHERARHALGYMRHEGEWMKEEDAMIAKGFVLFEGRWVEPEERDRLLEERKKKEEARLAAIEQRKQRLEEIKAEVRRRRLERELAHLERDTERYLNSITPNSTYDWYIRGDDGRLYVPVPVIVNVPARPKKTTYYSGLSLTGTYRFKHGNLVFDLRL